MDPKQRGCEDHADDGTPLFGMRTLATAPNMLPDEDRAAILEGAPTQ